MRDIVGGHGGMMNVQSALRVGSRFEAWLPFVTKDASSLTETEPAAPFGHGETVLVVDEAREQLLRDEEILAALGYEPVGFTRVADALEACREAPKRFDILLVAHHVAVATTFIGGGDEADVQRVRAEPVEPLDSDPPIRTRRAKISRTASGCSAVSPMPFRC